MTTKTTPKAPRTAARSQEEMQAAYECHTLAQWLFGYIATTHPWLVQPQYPGAAPPAQDVHGAAAWSHGWPGIEFQSPGRMR